MRAYTIVSHPMDFLPWLLNKPVVISERFALHWVQKYIAEFGGDPEKVTM